MPKIEIKSLRARAVNVPMRRPLRTGSGTVETAPLVLIDLYTSEGVTGCSYVFCYTALALKPVERLLLNLGETLAGQPLAPHDLEQGLRRRLRLIGAQGFTAMALAGIDMAAWDALAKLHGVPLATLLGSAPRPIQAYNSCGLGLIGVERAAVEAAELAGPGYKAVKVRLGYPDIAADIAVLRSVRAAVGDSVLLPVDYNQCLTVPEAIARAHRLDEEGVYWIEEPTLAEDYAGHASIAREARAPVQLGENWWGPSDMSKSLAAGASDFVMTDAVKIGGVSGWLRGAALAEAYRVPVSSHLFPEISAHLLAVTPTAHWLEYVDWAEPVLLEPVRVENGFATASSAPGAGIAWDEAAVARLLC